MIPILDDLYLGDRKSASDLPRLKEAGITHIVNCACELPNYHEEEFTYLTMNLVDPDPEFHKHIVDVCAFIDAARKEGKVLVHCFASISRSPSVVLCYLCHLGDSLERGGTVVRIVWTSPDHLFLQQLSEHAGVEWTEESIRRLEYLLQGRRSDL